jgi:hypothetical protein
MRLGSSASAALRNRLEIFDFLAMEHPSSTSFTERSVRDAVLAAQAARNRTMQPRFMCIATICDLEDRPASASADLKLPIH